VEDDVAVGRCKLEFFVRSALRRLGKEIDVERLVGMRLERLVGNDAALA
jgi:hypothetical protein